MRTDATAMISIDCNSVESKDIVEPALLPDRKYCHIRYEDNGIGFEQQYSNKIFELFQRLGSRDKYNGTGIGLAIVKKIVDNHNGSIAVTSEVNKGTVFNIYLPF